MLSVNDQIVVVPVYVFSFFLENIDIITGGYCDYPVPGQLV